MTMGHGLFKHKILILPIITHKLNFPESVKV